MIRVAIVEDSVKDTKKLMQHIADFCKNEGVEITTVCFKNGLDFLDAFKANYDIILMDIVIPHMSGLETAAKMRAIDTEVPLLFITNMAQYAINGYEVGAIGFILKPVSYLKFSFAMKKAVRLVNDNSAAVSIKTDGRIKKLNVAEICYIEVRNNVLSFKMSDGQKYLTRMPLHEAESMIKPNDTFIRCNNCYLVNLKYVTDVYGNFAVVGGDELSISRNKKKDFLNALTSYYGRRR